MGIIFRYIIDAIATCYIPSTHTSAFSSAHIFSISLLKSIEYTSSFSAASIIISMLTFKFNADILFLISPKFAFKISYKSFKASLVNTHSFLAVQQRPVTAIYDFTTSFIYVTNFIFLNLLA